MTAALHTQRASGGRDHRSRWHDAQRGTVPELHVADQGRMGPAPRGGSPLAPVTQKRKTKGRAGWSAKGSPSHLIRDPVGSRIQDKYKRRPASWRPVRGAAMRGRTAKIPAPLPEPSMATTAVPVAATSEAGLQSLAGIGPAPGLRDQQARSSFALPLLKQEKRSGRPISSRSSTAATRCRKRSPTRCRCKPCAAISSCRRAADGAWRRRDSSAQDDRPGRARDRLPVD